MSQKSQNKFDTKILLRNRIEQLTKENSDLSKRLSNTLEIQKVYISILGDLARKTGLDTSKLNAIEIAIEIDKMLMSTEFYTG